MLPEPAAMAPSRWEIDPDLGLSVPIPHEFDVISIALDSVGEGYLVEPWSGSSVARQDDRHGRAKTATSAYGGVALRRPRERSRYRHRLRQPAVFVLRQAVADGAELASAAPNCVVQRSKPQTRLTIGLSRISRQPSRSIPLFDRQGPFRLQAPTLRLKLISPPSRLTSSMKRRKRCARQPTFSAHSTRRTPRRGPIWRPASDRRLTRPSNCGVSRRPLA